MIWFASFKTDEKPLATSQGLAQGQDQGGLVSNHDLSRCRVVGSRP